MCKIRFVIPKIFIRSAGGGGGGGDDEFKSRVRLSFTYIGQINISNLTNDVNDGDCSDRKLHILRLLRWWFTSVNECPLNHRRVTPYKVSPSASFSTTKQYRPPLTPKPATSPISCCTSGELERILRRHDLSPVAWMAVGRSLWTKGSREMNKCIIGADRS